MRCPFCQISLLYCNLASGQPVDSEDVGKLYCISYNQLIARSRAHQDAHLIVFLSLGKLHRWWASGKPHRYIVLHGTTRMKILWYVPWPLGICSVVPLESYHKLMMLFRPSLRLCRLGHVQPRHYLTQHWRFPAVPHDEESSKIHKDSVFESSPSLEHASSSTRAGVPVYH
jgi:hypothetical protein